MLKLFSFVVWIYPVKRVKHDGPSKTTAKALDSQFGGLGFETDAGLNNKLLFPTSLSGKLIFLLSTYDGLFYTSPLCLPNTPNRYLSIIYMVLLNINDVLKPYSTE
uniref:Uncharacterized protein n=1 Tax=Cacopsylla melanoneura TaxID=428564 RepID=A0A8D8QZI2_9HEMI